MRLDRYAAIQGTVSSDNNVALAGITVEAFRYTEAPEPTWSYVHSAQTDETGAYSINSLEAGTYYLCFNDSNGYQYAPECYDNAASYESGTPVTVAPGATVAGIDAQLTRYARITGVVRDAAGNPLADRSVSAYTLMGEPEWAYWTQSAYGWTNEQGVYELLGLVPGTYRFGVSGGDQFIDTFYRNATNVEAADDIVVSTLGQLISDVDVQMMQYGSISGRITNAEGEPLPDIYLELLQQNTDGNWFYYRDGSTNADGEYRLEGLVPGLYQIGFGTYWDANYVPEYYDNALTVEEATPIALGGEPITGIDAQLARRSHIAGRITNADGEPLPNVHVTANRYSAADGYWLSAGNVWTDENGMYDVAGLGPDTYRLEFIDGNNRYLSEFYENARSLDEATDVVVGVEETVTVDARLVRAGAIRGAVTDANSQRLAFIAVRAYLRQDDGTWSHYSSAYTSESGTYELTGLPDGRYRVEFADESWPMRFYPEFYSDVATLEQAQDILVAAEQTVDDIDAQLTSCDPTTLPPTPAPSQPAPTPTPTLPATPTPAAPAPMPTPVVPAPTATPSPIATTVPPVAPTATPTVMPTQTPAATATPQPVDPSTNPRPQQPSRRALFLPLVNR